MYLEGPSSEVRDEMLESKPGSYWNRFGFIVDLNDANKIFNRKRYQIPALFLVILKLQIFKTLNRNELS